MVPISRRISGLLHGDYSGLLHRAGSELGDTRQYLEGDDVRRIDWPATARTAETQVHDTIADHELEAWFVVDTSPSMAFGTGGGTKQQLAADVVGALGYVVTHTGNRVGCITSGSTSRSLVPRGGTAHLAAVMAAVQPQKTNDNGSSKTLSSTIDACLAAGHRRGLVVVVSDFLDTSPWASSIARAAQKHDVIGVVISDPREHNFNDVGIVEFRDAETGRSVVVNTSDPQWRKAFAQKAELRSRSTLATLREAGVDVLELRCGNDWVGELATFLRSRKRRLAVGRRR
jgi:uncharacterized protein (DUF58 family)